MQENSAPESAVARGDVVISVSHVSKTYKLYPSHQDRLKEALHPFRKRYHEEFSALNDVSFEIRRGESVGILGRNGAGKSTLLQLIAGVLKPTSGTIKVAGTISALLELGAGFNPDLTGRENVLLANTIQGVSDKEAAERASAVESFADVGLFFDQPMKIYSSGMYARVAFAHAINVNPDVLIVDEILGVGDAKFQEKCYSRINDLRETGVSILFVSHSVDVIQRNCGMAILLDQGRLVKYDLADVSVATYHELLYGAKTIERANSKLLSTAGDPSSQQPQVKEIPSDSLLTLFIQDRATTGTYKTKRYYNSHERRLGNQDAEIVDFLVSDNDNFQFGVLAGDEILNIYAKVQFHRNVDKPQIGWAIATPEGIIIAGANTVMHGINLRTASRGEIVIYKQEIRLGLCGGQYFLNVGVGEHRNEEWAYFDVRRAVIHLAIKDLGRGSGFCCIPSSCKEVDALPE
jgi:lipopolysaccharide transport system ATP-binding protein